MFRGIFHRIPHDIYKCLLNMESIPNHVLVFHILDSHFQLMPLGIQLGTHHNQKIVNELRKINLLLRKFHFSRFNLAHIQNFINQCQKMFAGTCHLRQAIRHPFFVVQMSCRNGRHSDNGIHGSSDIMAHVGKEIRFRLICPVSGLIGVF